MRKPTTYQETLLFAVHITRLRESEVNDDILVRKSVAAAVTSLGGVQAAEAPSLHRINFRKAKKEGA